MKRLLFILVLLSSPSLSGTMWAAEPWRAPSTQIDSVYPQVEALYLDLHRNPELSYHEEKTAAKIADQLRKLGYDVTSGVGGTGVVGVFKNGSGPVVMLRAELDALPVLGRSVSEPPRCWRRIKTAGTEPLSMSANPPRSALAVPRP